MSAFAMKPIFKDADGYRSWRAQWRKLFKKVSSDIRAAKARAKALQRAPGASQAAQEAQRDLVGMRTMGSKLMTLLVDARVRWGKLQTMQAQIDEQFASFPLSFDKCQTVDFHFNKGSIEFPALPMWVVKAKGKSFYVHHVDAQVPWSTRELPEGSTRGMIRLRNCRMEITADGIAILSPP